MGGLPDIVKKRAQNHGLFKTRLLATSTKFKATRIVHGSEAYTSKQCGACGNLNNDLGTSETWTCSANCGCELADRDVHAARAEGHCGLSTHFGALNSKIELHWHAPSITSSVSFSGR
jgi:transposase